MKKAAAYVLYIAFGVTLIALICIGVKLFKADYEILTEAYIAGAGFLVIFVCSIIKMLGSKCPHCGKTVLDNGKYCSHCGKKFK